METSVQRRRKATRVGVVVSNKMDKTAVVAVETLVMDRKYKKYVKSTTKFMAHDERNECQMGDKVLIVEDRPRSKNKNWRVRDIIARAAIGAGGAKAAQETATEEKGE
jgi:small subunit ribosomal protein S17